MKETSNHFVQKSTRAQLWLRLPREDLIYKKTRANKTVVTQQISDVQKPNLLLQNKALDRIGDAMWPAVMP